jgi:hypothetical protein
MSSVYLSQVDLNNVQRLVNLLLRVPNVLGDDARYQKVCDYISIAVSQPDQHQIDWPNIIHQVRKQKSHERKFNLRFSLCILKSINIFVCWPWVYKWWLGMPHVMMEPIGLLCF